MADPTRQKLLEVGKKLLQERKSRVGSSSNLTPTNISIPSNNNNNSINNDQHQQSQPHQQQTAIPAQNDELIRLTFKVSAQSHRIEELINENLQLQEALSRSDSHRFKARCGELEQENQELLAQLAAQQEDDKAGLISSLQSELMNEKEQHARNQIELTHLAEKSQQKQLALDIQLEKQASTIENLTEQKINIRRQLQEQIDKLSEDRKRLEEDLKIRSQQAKEYFQLQQQLEMTVREKDLEVSGLQNELRRYQFGQDQLLEIEAKRVAGVRQNDEEKNETIAKLQKKIEEDLIEKQNLMEELKTIRSKLRDTDHLRESGKRTVLEQGELLSLMQIETEKKQRENQERHENDTKIIQSLMEEKEKLMVSYEEKLCATRNENNQKLKQFKDIQVQLLSEIERASARAAKASSERDLFIAECEDLRQQNNQLRSLLEQQAQNQQEEEDQNHKQLQNQQASERNSLAQQNLKNNDGVKDEGNGKEDEEKAEILREFESANQKIAEKEEVINKLTTEKLEIVLQLNSRTDELIQLRDRIQLLQKEQKQQQTLPQGNTTREPIVVDPETKKEKRRKEERVEDESEYEGTLESLQEKRIYQLLDEIEELKNNSTRFPEDSSRNRAMSDAGDNGRLSFHVQSKGHIQKLSERTQCLEKELISQTKKNTLLLQEISFLRRRLTDSAHHHDIGIKRFPSADNDDIGTWLSYFPILGHLVSRKNFENTCELIV
eukprot:TRINITY_DN7551_c0_g1_i1.p1 TRINITY_DN7551_c0_g1~~TRINITY_DN7551_c0_g1_i1.p1  ORF type:complete len:723 (-),score=216.60 TRINITY_DN7551_c0_g1_i1:151-2319(-)